MEHSIVLLHGGALAYYLVSEDARGGYTARLQKFTGEPGSAPPSNFELHKVGRHWQDEGHEQDLIDEMGKAIDLLYRKEGPVDPERARGWGKDPGSL